MRRHEAEVQQLRSELRDAQQAAIGKREEVSRLNLDAARLVAELAGAHRELYTEQQKGRSLEIKLDQMRGFESQCVALTAQMEERKEWHALLEKQLEQARTDGESARRALSSAQQELTAAIEKLTQLETPNK